MITEYKVEQKINGKWTEIYSDRNEFYARNVAGGLSTLSPQTPVRMFEIRFKNGRLKEMIEYGVSPPTWSGSPEITARGPEIFIRERKKL